MGGKQKQGQRVKGNARPSSSIRSAEKLVASGAGSLGSAGLVGAAANSYLGLVKPKSAPGDEEVDTFLDGDCRMLMKKMTKKDAITRLKALQEFQNFCTTCDEELLKGALPFWPRHFNRLSQDCDRRVREVTHVTNSRIVSRMKKNLAPHLKAIMGNWLICLSDPHAPAASAAQSAFQSAFAPAKQLDVLLFCKEEILSLIGDNLLQQTTPDLVPAEEMEGTQNRIVSTSLLALAAFLERVPIEEHDKLSTTYDALLDHKTFWTFPQSDVPMIRQGWFCALSAACTALPSLIERRGKKVTSVILGSINETNPAVVGAVFEAALHLVVSLKSCWTHVSASKTVMPKVWCSLRRGCEGNATIIGPYLLPFISKVPKESFANDFLLYEEFFTNCRLGLDLSQVKHSSSEYNALIRAYVEVATFATKELLLQTSTDSANTKAELIMRQLLPIIESALVERDTKIASITFNLIGDYLEYVCVCSSSKTFTPTVVDSFKMLQTLFWQSITIHGRSLLTATSDEPTNRISLQRLSGLCRCALLPTSKPRAARKVCFRVESETAADDYKDDHVIPATVQQIAPESTTESISAESITDKSVTEQLSTKVSNSNLSTHSSNRVLGEPDSPLLTLASELCVTALTAYLDSRSLSHLQFFSEMLTTFSSEHLFEHLLSHCNSARTDSRQASAPMRFYAAFIESNMQIERNRTCVDHLLDVIFCVYESVSSEERPQIIRRVIDAGDVYTLDRVIDRLIPRYVTGDNCATRCLTMPDVCAAINGTIARLLLPSTEEPLSNDDRDTSWNILRICLPTRDKYRFLSTVDLDAILKIVLASLKQCYHQEHQPCAEIGQLMANLLANASWCWSIATSQQLLLEYFLLDCNHVTDDHDITANRDSQFKQIWVEGLKSLIRSQGGLVTPGGFLYEAIVYVHRQVVSQPLIDIAEVEHLSTLVNELLMEIYEALPTDDLDGGLIDVSPIAELVTLLLPAESDWNEMVATLWSTVRAGEIQIGRLHHSTIDGVEDVSLASVTPLAFALMATRLMNLLSNGACTGVLEFVLDDERVWCHVRGIFECVAYSRCAERFVKDFGRLPSEKCAASFFQIIPLRLQSLMYASAQDKLSLANLFHQEALNGGLTSAYVFREVLAALNDIRMVSYPELSKKIGFVDSTVDTSAFVKVDLVTECQSGSAALHIFQLLISESDVAGMYLLEELLNTWRPAPVMQDVDVVYLAALTECFARLPLPRSEVEEGESPVLEHAVSTVMNAVIGWKEQLEDRATISLASTSSAAVEDLFSRDWTHLSKVVQVVRLLTALIQCGSRSLQSVHWDFVLCTLGLWSQRIENCSTSLESEFPLQILACSTFQLASTVAAAIKVFSTQDDEKRGCPANLITEWREFFSAEIYGPMLNLFCQWSAGGTPSRHYGFVLQSLVSALDHMEPSVVENNRLETTLSAEWDSGDEVTSNELKTALNRLCPLLTSDVRDVRFGAFLILRNCVSLLVSGEEAKMSVNRPTNQEAVAVEEQPTEEEITRPLPGALLESLTRSQAACESALSVVDLCDTMEVEPGGEMFATVSGHLLAWQLALDLFSQASPELRSLLAGHLRNTGLLNSLADNLFRLMPKTFVSSSTFTDHFAFSVTSPPTANEVASLACYVYLDVLGTMPALVRDWWNALDKRHMQHVDKFTTQHVSQLLATRDVLSVQRTKKKMINMVVRARPTAREVVATYSVEEISCELIIKLSVNHPLGIVNIETGKRVGVTNSQWSYWLLQLRTFLMNQNGSILDGLELWKRNIDKKFEGIEECYVCYYVLHGTTYQLPRLVCRTCKKKFHSACLYKWFNTSGHSTCPLCRSIF